MPFRQDISAAFYRWNTALLHDILFVGGVIGISSNMLPVMPCSYNLIVERKAACEPLSSVDQTGACRPLRYTELTCRSCLDVWQRQFLDSGAQWILRLQMFVVNRCNRHLQLSAVITSWTFCPSVCLCVRRYSNTIMFFVSGELCTRNADVAIR